MLEQFRKFGRELFLQGVNSSHSGNISVRMGDRVLITRRGSMLADLSERDLIETGLEEDDSHIVLASTEIKIHRAVYQSTSALAIVHAHPPITIALSMLGDEIRPVDTEGIYYFKSVPVITTELTVGADEVAEKLPPVLRDYRIAVLRGHGSFATGQVLEEAYQWTSSLEAACKVICYARLLGLHPEGAAPGW